MHKSRMSYQVISVIGVTGIVSASYGFIAESKRNRKAIVESNQQHYDDNQKRMLSEIDSNNVMKDFVFLLVFTDGNQQPQIREKAVAKMKTHSEWQQELIRYWRLRTSTARAWRSGLLSFLTQ